MSVKKDFVKLDGGKEKTDLASITEFLNEEAEDITSKIDKAQGQSISQMNIKIVCDEIDVSETEEGPLFIVSIAKLDDKYYGAFYNVNAQLQYAEELYIRHGKSPTPGNIASSFLIEDPTEWEVICEFFIKEHVFEMARLFNWTVQAKANEDIRDNVRKLVWYEKVSKDLKAKGKKELTPEEVAQKMLMSRNWPRLQSGKVMKIPHR